MMKLIHAHTEAHSSFPAYINLSGLDGAGYRLIVRSTGHDGQRSGEIILTREQLAALVDDAVHELYGRRLSVR